jgi:hypothetical protein
VLSPEDDRWNGLIGGYRVPFDPRPMIRKLEASPEDDKIWSQLIEELYHQGDVGTASYAAIPCLIHVCIAQKILPWQLFALTVFVEEARVHSDNLGLPSWVQDSYLRAIEVLGLASLEALQTKTSDLQTRGMLSVVALWKGLSGYANVLVNFTEKELEELLSQ